MTKCWKCYYPSSEKIRFRTECEKCGSYLHCCKNCQNYSVGKPNDCLIPGTELVKDREIINYCEEFSPLIEKKHPPKNTQSNFGSLFKDEN